MTILDCKWRRIANLTVVGFTFASFLPSLENFDLKMCIVAAERFVYWTQLKHTRNVFEPPASSVLRRAQATHFKSYYSASSIDVAGQVVDQHIFGKR